MTNAPWQLIGFELLSTQLKQSVRCLPAYAFGASFKSYTYLWLKARIFIQFKNWELRREPAFGFEILTAVVMKSVVFWVVTPCSLEKAWHFQGTYCLYLCGWRHQLDACSKQSSPCHLPHAGFLLCWLFDHEDRASMFLWNVQSSNNLEVNVIFRLVWFQTLEVDNALERCRLLESQSKVKLVEPQLSQTPTKFPKK
jgi:hypothetical protein